MKKLRMIVTSVIVFAIVGSALAFKAKMASFCVDTNGDGICDAILNAVRTTVGTPNYQYKTDWDGDRANCIGTPCPKPVRLVAD